MSRHGPFLQVQEQIQVILPSKSEEPLESIYVMQIQGQELTAGNHTVPIRMRRGKYLKRKSSIQVEQ